MRKNDLEGQIRLDQMYREGDSREKAVRRLWMIARIFRGCVSKSAARLVIFLADQDVVIP